MTLSIRKALVLPNAPTPPPLGNEHGLVAAFREVFGAPNVIGFDHQAYLREGNGTRAVREVFLDMVKRQQPDWIFLHLEETGALSPETIEAARTLCPRAVITHWIGDYMPTVSSRVAALSQVCDQTLVSSMGQLAAFTLAGARDVAYMQVGIDWAADVLGQPDWTPPFRVPDVVFVGNHYPDSPWPDGTAERLAAVCALVEAGFDVGVVGRGWPDGFPVVGHCDRYQQHHVWKRAMVAINVNHANDVQNYYSDRMLIAMASGAPMVTRWVPGLADEFEFGVHMLWYEDVSNLPDLVRENVESWDGATEMAQQGRWEVMRNHSWTARILDTLPMIEQLADGR